MTEPSYEGRKTLVVGLGSSGLAASRYLLSRGASVRANDLQPREAVSEAIRELEALGCELALGGNRPSLVDGIDLVVLSPGVPLTLPLVRRAFEAKIPVWSELELGFRAMPNGSRVVAVTGTKGKSTTATLIERGLHAAGESARLVGNIGIPIVEEVQRMSGSETLVVEASSFQLATIDTFRPSLSVLLDVSPDHLDWHPDLDHYIWSKRRIFENQQNSDRALVYGGSEVTRSMVAGVRCPVSYFGLHLSDSLERARFYFRDGEAIARRDAGLAEGPEGLVRLARCDALSIPGDHNVANFIAAVGALDLLAVSAAAAERGARGFKGLEHALELVAEVAGVRYVNDSKATQIAAVGAAIRSFESGTIHLILGGRAKGGDFRTLRPLIDRVSRLYAFGESRELIKNAFADIKPVEMHERLEAIVDAARVAANPGDVVLLSPGGSSFDLFENYRHRGQRFREIVRGMAARDKNDEAPGNGVH